MADLPKLSPKYAAAVEAYRENGGDAVHAYMVAYPASMGWKAETVQRRAAQLFEKESVKAHLSTASAPSAPPAEKKPKYRRGMNPHPNPPAPPSKLTAKVRKLIESYAHDYRTVHEHPFPSVVGLARVCDVSSETIYQWSRDPRNADLLPDTLRKIDTFQHHDLISQGFTGEGNATITKLLLTTKHGYQEVQLLEHTGKGGGPIESAQLGITAELPPQEAAKRYREMIGGE